MVQTSKRTGLQAMLQPGIHYDDLLICNSQGVYKNGMSLLDQILEQMNNHYAGTQNSVYLHDIKLYPNPANTIVNIAWTNTSMRSIELFDALGHSISKTEINSNGQTSAEIATDQLANGVYLIQVNQEFGSKIYKIVVEHP